MGNIKGSLTLGQFSILQIEIVLRNGIKGGSGLVKNKDGSILVDRAGKKQLLHLATGEVNAVIVNALHEMRIDPVRQIFHLLPDPGIFHGGNSVFSRCGTVKICACHKIMHRERNGPNLLVNGRRISEYNIEEYYSMISAVFQEVRPIAFTMHDFVASADLDRPTAREDTIAAMKAAGIWEKVENLPNGIDTHLMKGIYDDGVDFSGGEMQKLLLARAIYQDVSLLSLDEPTAALDPIAENNLYMQYRELTKGKTSLYISHRFASTRFCDRIILMENGVITESGTHDELMARDGQYAYMFGVQSKYYKEGEVHA